MNVVRVAGWERYSWLRHGFSTRLGGLSTVYTTVGATIRGGHDLNLGFTRDDDREAVAGNRALFLRAVAGDEPAELVALRQVHGTRAEVVTAGEQRAALEADGLLTASPGVMLGIHAADCVPVLVADTRLRVVAGFHAGWRGTAAGIVELGIAQLRTEFGSSPEDLIGAVGPAIGVCCYTVGDEVREAFAARFAYVGELFSLHRDGMHVDLAEANRRQLTGAGLAADRVAVVGECTACARVEGLRKYFSHRAERGFTGRGMGMIGIAHGS